MEIDRRKAAIYAAADVPEYWIIMPESRQVEVHSGLAGGQYNMRRFFHDGREVRSEVLPTFALKVSELFPA